MRKNRWSYRLTWRIEQGRKMLGDEASALICRYVESQRTENEAFINRGGKEELYYTMFGWMLCRALGLKSVSRKRKTFLQNVDKTNLDDRHRAVYRLCRGLHLLWQMPRPFADGIHGIVGDGGVLADFFASYLQHGSGTGANAWAVATLAGRREATEKLLALQDVSGGFRAHDGAPFPDLLSTAVALFALAEYGLCPSYGSRDFIRAHWLPDGGFAPTLFDDRSDVEYVFYGLLALGSVNE